MSRIPSSEGSARPAAEQWCEWGGFGREEGGGRDDAAGLLMCQQKGPSISWSRVGMLMRPFLVAFAPIAQQRVLRGREAGVAGGRSWGRCLLCTCGNG